MHPEPLHEKPVEDFVPSARLENSGKHSRPVMIYKGQGVNPHDAALVLFEELKKSGGYYRRKRESGTWSVWRFRGGELSEVRPVQLVTECEAFVQPHTLTINNGSFYEKRAQLSTESAGVLLADIEAVEVLPPVCFIAARPLLVDTPTGIATLGHGYHRHGGGTLITGKIVIPAVPFSEAVARLKGLFRDYDFVGKGDESRAIAGLIAPAMRIGGFIDKFRTPIDFSQADGPGAGKGVRAAINAAVYGEKVNIIAQTSGGVGSFDEAFNRSLLAARMWVVLDNLKGSLNSQLLEALTDPVGLTHTARGIGFAGEVDLRGLITHITSNGISITEDLKRRISPVSFRKRPDGYRYHDWQDGPRIDTHIERHQAYYLGCVHAVIREWDRRGRGVTEASHSFDDWARKLDWIVQNLFACAPLLDGLKQAVETMGDPFRRWLRGLALHIVGNGIERDGIGDHGVFIASQLAEIAAESGKDELAIPKPPRSSDSNEQFIGRGMARILGPKPGKVGMEPPVDIGGVFIIRRTHTETDPNTGRGHPVVTYLFRQK